MIVSPHRAHDWCHLCGNRTNALADVWYPENAEHDFHKRTPPDKNYVRICVICAETIFEATRR